MLVSHEEQLKNLKDKLMNREMSVLVGAGFSKNVSPIFPDWRSLLYDMTEFLFASDIERELKTAVSGKRKSDKFKADFKRQRLDELIDEVGYLDIVSMYVKRKGYREALSSYIEEKTPRVEQRGKRKYLVNRIGGVENRIELHPEMLGLHRQLLNLGWNNIYTTNYDEMLEEAIDSATIDSIKKEIRRIEEELVELNEHQKGLDQRKKELESVVMPKPSLPIQVDKVVAVQGSDLEDEEAKEREVQLRDVRYKSESNQREIKAKKSELRKHKVDLNDCLTVVRSSGQLSLKRNHNIIKVHGSIRGKLEPFGFDGDSQKHYIISREDYDTYPNKHEAFTQLMRISLLQESYCLIGFSGDDTNFIEWVKWVREILERDKPDHRTSDYKIYLIDIGAGLPDADKQLFYENHRIYRIPLASLDVIEFLRAETKMKDVEASNKRNLIKAFLHFLARADTPILPGARHEVKQQNRYVKLWQDVNSQNEQPVEQRIKNAKAIMELKPFCRIPEIGFYYTGSKRSFLFFTMKFLSDANGDSTVQRQLLSLAIIAMKDSFLSLGTLWDELQFQAIYKVASQHPSLKIQFDFFRLRESLLNQDVSRFTQIANDLSDLKSGEQQNELIYLTILYQAFSFDFQELIQQLDNWNPTSHWLLKKVGLLCHFDTEMANEIMVEHCLNFDTETNQEQLYSLHLSRFIKPNLYERNEELNAKIEAYKSDGLKTIDTNLDLLFDGMKPASDKVKPYGDGRYTISNSISLSNDTSDPQKGLQFLLLLMESGFPLASKTMQWRGHEDWKPIFDSIFWYYPYPTLFYALQYSDEGFLKKIGQEFTFSESLQEKLEDILKRLLKAYFAESTPARYKRNILVFCSTLLNAVDPAIWEWALIEIWNTKDFEKHAFNRMRPPIHIFSLAATHFVQEVDTIRMILTSCIRNSKEDAMYSYLQAVYKGQRFKTYASEIQSPQLGKIIDLEIGKLVESADSWWMLHYLNEILNEEQKSRIRGLLPSIDYSRFRDENIWGSVLLFANGDKVIHEKIKPQIVKSQHLWDAGFSDEGLSSYSPFIHLSNLERVKYLEDGLVWDKSEAKAIFQRLLNELKKIDLFLEKRKGHTFRFILQEMYLFLKYNNKQLEDIPDYLEVYSRIEQMYFEHRGFMTIMEGILSEDSSEVVWALSDLTNELRRGTATDNLKMELSALLNKVLLQSQPSLEASLGFVSGWMTDVPSLFVEWKDLLLAILHQYKIKELTNCDKAFVLHQLVIISKRLKALGVDYEVVEFWIEEGENSTFNRVRFMPE